MLRLESIRELCEITCVHACLYSRAGLKPRSYRFVRISQATFTVCAPSAVKSTKVMLQLKRRARGSILTRRVGAPVRREITSYNHRATSHKLGPMVQLFCALRCAIDVGKAQVGQVDFVRGVKSHDFSIILRGFNVDFLSRLIPYATRCLLSRIGRKCSFVV